MANPRRTATIMPSVAAIEGDPGPLLPHYVIPLDRPCLYKWIPGDATTVDHYRVLGHTGGCAGTWKQVGLTQTVIGAVQGANLTDADASLTVAGGRLRVLPASTLSANHSATLSTTGAVEDDEITITRLDAEAWTYAIVNGGAGGGTLTTLPASQRWFATFYFDGTDWLLKAAGQMP